MLALLNNDFILVSSKAFAAELQARASGREGQIELACERVWGRLPSNDEKLEMTAFAAKHGLPSLCRLLLNSSEFLFAD